MFEKIFGNLFVKSDKKSGITVISKKREIKPAFGTVKSRDKRIIRDDFFWENRGKSYAALFTSLNGRVG